MAIQDVVLPGAGSKVATDKIGADRLVQLLKLAVGAEGVLALAAAGAGAVDAGTLRTTLASDDAAVLALAAIQAAASDTTTPSPVIGYLNAVPVTPTVSATPDYSAGDTVGGVMTFAGILRADGETSYAVSAVITAKTAAASMAQIDILIFNANPSASTATDNAAFVLADADRSKLKGVIRVTSFDVVGATAAMGYAEGRVPVTGAAADDLYAVMVARGTINLGATDDLVVELAVDQN